MIKVQHDTFTLYQTEKDPLAVVLDGIKIDKYTTPRSHYELHKAWDRMTDIQRQLYGCRLCKLFLGDKTGKVFYELLMSPPPVIESRVLDSIKRICNFFRLGD